MVFASDLDLDDVEARVVGSLIEKSMTTPDAYPLSTNGVTTACNQKSARDPVMSVTSVMVDAAALSLRQRGWTRTVRGGRTSKHRHVLDEYLSIGNAQLAVLGVLLLRGPQTVGELRQRTDRMHPFESTDEVENTLLGLAGREVPLVRRLERQPGQKEARWTHLLSSSASSDGAVLSESEGSSDGAVPSTSGGPSASPSAQRAVGSSEPSAALAPADGSQDVAAGGSQGVTAGGSQEVTAGGSPELAALRAELDELRRRFDALCASLGEDTI